MCMFVYVSVCWCVSVHVCVRIMCAYKVTGDSAPLSLDQLLPGEQHSEEVQHRFLWTGVGVQRDYASAHVQANARAAEGPCSRGEKTPLEGHLHHSGHQLPARRHLGADLRLCGTAAHARPLPVLHPELTAR